MKYLIPTVVTQTYILWSNKPTLYKFITLELIILTLFLITYISLNKTRN